MFVVPTLIGDFELTKCILDIYQLEEAIKRADKTALPICRTNALKAGIATLKVANKFALIKTEALKLMGVYFWVIGKQRKAITWWRKSISRGAATE